MRVYAARATEDPSRSKLSKPGVNRLSSTAQQSLGTVEQKLPSTDVRVLEPNQLLHLQRTIGNHRVGELLGRAYGMASPVGSSVHPEQEPVLPRLRAKHRLSQIPSFASAPVGLRAKLTVGPPGDRYEQEADRVADQVMRMPDPHAHRKTPGHAPLERSDLDGAAGSGPIQRSDSGRRLDEDERLQAEAQPGATPTVSGETASGIQSLRGRGRSLPERSRSFFEPRFGFDLREVKIHDDAEAARLASNVLARAFTIGRDVVFGAGQYRPDTADGMRLMAHELTHVVQQEAAGWKSVQAKPAIDQPGSPFEREADFMADAVTSSSPSPSGGQTGSTLPFREATELLDCIRIMGEANRDYCRAVVLGEKPEVVEEAWVRVHTTGPRLLDGREPSYQVGFNHLLPPVPTGVKQMWQVVESTHTLLTDQCELKTETDFRIDIVDIGSRTRINDSWGWIRRDNPCFAMEESKATVGFDDQISNLAQQTSVKASKQLAEDTLGKMTGPKGTYSGVYTFVKRANCRDCPEKLKEIQEQNKARNGEALTIEGIGSWRS